MGSTPSHSFESRLGRLRQGETHCLWMNGKGCAKTGHQSSFPVTRRVRLLLQAGCCCERDSSISASGSPGLRGREALRGQCERGGAGPGQGQRWPPPWPAFRPTPILCLSSSPGRRGDPGGVVTSSLFISFSHSLGSQGRRKKGTANPNHRLESTLRIQ